MMKDNVIKQTWPTTVHIPPERVLAKAAEQSFRDVIVIGVLADGGEYFAGSTSDAMVMNWMADRFKAACIGPPTTMVQANIVPDCPPDNVVFLQKDEPTA